MRSASGKETSFQKLRQFVLEIYIARKNYENFLQKQGKSKNEQTETQRG
jgi:hypothetical protein